MTKTTIARKASRRVVALTASALIAGGLLAACSSGDAQNSADADSQTQSNSDESAAEGYCRVRTDPDDMVDVSWGGRGDAPKFLFVLRDEIELPQEQIDVASRIRDVNGVSAAWVPFYPVTNGGVHEGHYAILIPAMNSAYADGLLRGMEPNNIAYYTIFNDQDEVVEVVEYAQDMESSDVYRTANAALAESGSSFQLDAYGREKGGLIRSGSFHTVIDPAMGNPEFNKYAQPDPDKNLLVFSAVQFDAETNEIYAIPMGGGNAYRGEFVSYGGTFTPEDCITSVTRE